LRNFTNGAVIRDLIREFWKSKEDQTMMEDNPPPSGDSASVRVIPLPVALYVSDELIFELYNGGQPYRRFSIRWERLVASKENEPQAAPQRSSTGLHTHQD
jgi:hypothetical protein